MAIKNNDNINDLITVFIKNSIFLKEYESTDKIINNCKHDYNLAKKVASEITKSVKQLLISESGLIEFIKLLDNEKIEVAASAAEYLYPLYPKKCIKILKKYSKSLKNRLDSYKIECEIEGITSQEKFFIDSYKKLYNTDNLGALNRENKVINK